MIVLSKIEARKDGKVMCVYANESCLPTKDIMKKMKAAGYKFYKDGKLYKPDNTIQN